MKTKCKMCKKVITKDRHKHIKAHDIGDNDWFCIDCYVKAEETWPNLKFALKFGHTYSIQ